MREPLLEFSEIGAQGCRAVFDPRTVARDIHGVFDALFSQLTPGMVAFFNRQHLALNIGKMNQGLLAASALAPSMLAEIALVVVEHRLRGMPDDLDACLPEALERQRKYFDALLPSALNQDDVNAAYCLADRLVDMLQQTVGLDSVVVSPNIPGYQWISSGVGDFSTSSSLIEVKSASKMFSSADYRQVAMYWLLSYIAALESGVEVWRDFYLVNPKIGVVVNMDFSPFIQTIGSGKSLIELAQLFAVVVGTRSNLG